MEKSWSRQQMEKELAAGKSGRSASPLIKPGSEDEIQATFFQWIDLYKDTPGFMALRLCYAIPNAGFASQKQGALRKLTGRRPGVPDVHLPMRPHGGANFIGLWIEFKRPGEKPTKEQLEWHDNLRGCKHFVAVCTSWTDAANIVIEYLGLPLAKL